MSLIRQVTTPVAGLVLLAATACGSGGAGGDGRGCSRDLDCPGDRVCRHRRCGVADAQTRQLSFVIRPENASDFRPQRAEDVAARPGERITLALQPSLLVKGSITFPDSARPGPPGTLLARPAAARSGSPTQIEVDDGTFAGQLTPGRYDLTFVPADRENMPVKRWPDRTLRSDTQLDLTLTSDLQSVQANVVFSPAGAAGGEVAAIEGARVHAVSADGRFTTTVATSGDGGVFLLRYPPDTGPYDIHVEPTPSAPSIPRTVFEDAIPARDPPSTIGRLDLGTFPRPARRLDVQLQFTLPAGTAGSDPWRGMGLVLVAELGKGRSVVREFIGPDGTADLDVLPTEYTLYARPRPDAAIGPQRWTVDFDAQVPDAPLELPPAPIVRGTVREKGGGPAPDSSLTFTPVSAPDGPTPDSRRAIARTDRAGSFRTHLRSAPHVAVIEPAPTSSAPLTRRSIDPTVSENPIELELAPPRVVAGSVAGRRSETGLAPIDGASVSVYEERSGERRLMGRTRTDGRGRFRLFISANQ